MRARSTVVQASLLLPVLLAATAFGCAKSDTIGDTFQNLGGSGGNGSGGENQGASGAGDTTTSDTTDTTGSTTTAATTTSSTTGSTGTTTTTTAPACNDTGAEPNDTEATAKNLGSITDCDGTGASFSGVLDGAEDVDWYRYYGDDTFGCVVDLTRAVEFMAPARLCKFAACYPSGDSPSFECPGGTTGATSPDGRTGCCAFGGFVMDIDCPGGDDDADIFLRIDNPNAGACIPYTVDYHY